MRLNNQDKDEKFVEDIPEFYVLYTGDSPWDDRILRLSDGFLRHSDGEDLPENSMEVVVKVIDVRYNEDNEIIKRSKTLEGYSRLICYIKENRAQGMSRETSVDAAINRCVSEGFLVEFLQNRKEVSKMILGCNITMEEYGQVQRENGRLEGLQEGGIITLILDNLEEGIPKERIISKLMKRFQLTEDEACNYYMQTTKDVTKDL